MVGESDINTQDIKRVKIGLLGASFSTGNLGVSTLAESSIKAIMNSYSSREILFFASGYKPQQEQRNIADEMLNITSVPLRFSKNIFLPYHFMWMVLFAFLVKLSPGKRLKNAIAAKNRYFKKLYEIDFAADIAGGDSFSDIYGFKRFFLGFLVKWLVMFVGKDLVLLPQTYGPFKNSLSKKMAAYILRKAKIVYSRDADGVECAKHLLKGKGDYKVRLCPDVAFILDAEKTAKIDLSGLEKAKTEDTIIIGLNISGLLYNGGYTRDNMFGLKSDYRKLIGRIIELLLSYEDTVVLLVPHVFPTKELEVESDATACQKVYEKLMDKYLNRLFIAQGEYGHREIKYIIGLCDFFVGSRMHSCIAAISQCVPAVGLAYSKKFTGVFETVGISDCVPDMRLNSQQDILDKIEKSFNDRKVIQERLNRVIPGVRQQVLSLFDGIEITQN